MSILRFEWDPHKAESNFHKHGITFSEAESVFYDDEHSDDESRFLMLGFSKNARLLLICHCYRENDSIIRLISARKATKREAKHYHW